MADPLTPEKADVPAAANTPKAMVFGSSDLRLTGGQWLAVLGLFGLLILFTPRLWTRIERFSTGPDYRLPYSLSRDYWLFERRMRAVASPTNIILLGDSVVWGEYVLPEGTWSAFLNRQSRNGSQFINGGVNGMFPLALEGLVRHYTPLPRGQRILLNCNLLWLTSPQADLSTDKEEQFNHARLVPQFWPRIPCYRANGNERLSAIIQNHVSFLAWVNHLQDASFEQKSIPAWTLASDSAEPPRFPNADRNPLSQITLTVPSAPEVDPQRGPQSPRHHAWSEQGNGSTRFDWVELDVSLQWAAFQRLVRLLRERDCDVFVVVGPFNEHLLAENNRPPYRKIREGISAWLAQEHIAHQSPDPLPSELYADASHPLTAGYGRLAQTLWADVDFQHWLENP